MALGLESVYGDNEVGSDGLTKKQRKYREDSIAHDKMMDEMTLKQISSKNLSDFDDRESFEKPLSGKLPEGGINGNLPRSRPASSASTIKSRDAAAALSDARPGSIRARPASVQLPAKPKASGLFRSKNTAVPSNPSSMRHTAAVAGSKTTVGYAKGRSVSSALHGTALQNKKQTTAPKRALSPAEHMQLYGPPPFGSDMWIRCKTAGCFDEESGHESACEEVLPTLGEDEEAEDFQLTL